MCGPTRSEGLTFLPSASHPLVTVLTNRSRCLLTINHHRGSSQAETWPHPLESSSPVAMITLLIHTSLLHISQNSAKRPVWENRLLPLRNLSQNPWPGNSRNSGFPRKKVDSQKKRNGLSLTWDGMTGLHRSPTVRTEA